MNKIFKHLAGPTVLLIAGLMFSCPGKKPGEYVNREQGFAITFPADWEVREKEAGFVVTGLAPLMGPSDDFRENVAVAVSEMKTPLTAEQVLDSNLPAMQKIITDFKPEKRGTTALEGREAAWLRYSMRYGTYRLTVTRFAVPGKTRAYLIDCTAETETAAQYQEFFAQIVKSLEVTK